MQRQRRSLRLQPGEQTLLTKVYLEPHRCAASLHLVYK